jgi:hypothetical protein
MYLKEERFFRWNYEWAVISRQSQSDDIAVQFWDYWYGGPGEDPILPEDYEQYPIWPVKALEPA